MHGRASASVDISLTELEAFFFRSSFALLIVESPPEAEK